MPKELSYNTSSGVVLKTNPDKTTTVLGNYQKDMSGILDELDYPKTLNFEEKKGGFNVLNSPDELYKTPDQFWEEYNKPFLDKAIDRGDDIVLATKPDSKFLHGEGQITGFGREYEYLNSKGYVYNTEANTMTSPLK